MSGSESDDNVTKEQEEATKSDDDASTEKPEESTSNKRPYEEAPDESDESDNEWIGPLPTEAAAPAKKKKGPFCNFMCERYVTHNPQFISVLHYEKLYLENLPNTECYEKSYMHRDNITHIVVTKTDFVITASVDGHVKFWKKMEEGIEFVKHFRSHLRK